MRRIARDIKSFISGKDLVVFAIGLALSARFQETIKSLIDSLIMPFVSKLTGVTALNTRQLVLEKEKDGKPGISLKWGAALESVIVFFITLVIMVEIARYITVNFIKSSTVSFD